MTIRWAVAAILSLAVLLGWLRLAFWWRAAPNAARSRPWRLAMLAAGQAVIAALLFLTLFPPMMAIGTRETLRVATRGTSRAAMIAAGGALVALPEALAPVGIPTEPDLATALRHRPGVQRLQILGQGLEPRDQDAAHGMAILFDPPTLPAGLVTLAPPERVAPGAAFAVGGETTGMHGMADLIDPGGARVATAPIDADGRFVLSGAARVVGPALFAVRLRDPRGALVEEAPVPVVAVLDPPVRVLFLAGAPGPEVKYWRRWALDAGLAVTVRESIGAGLVLGDPQPPLGAAMLARYDLVIVDDRSWAALSGAERAALAAAVRSGLGLLLRATAPLPPDVRQGWAALGAMLSDGAATAPVRSRDVGEPALTRRVLPLAAAPFVPLLRDADGAILASWRALGRGRVGVWSVADDFGLVTSGHGDRYGSWWSDTVGALARARPQNDRDIATLPQAGRRIAICGVASGTSVVSPDRRTAALLPDAAGCAGFWPNGSGWYTLLRGASSTPFYVYPDGAIPGVRAADRRAATFAHMIAPATSTAATARIRSSSWPWLLLFLLCATAFWWFERAPFGRPSRS